MSYISRCISNWSNRSFNKSFSAITGFDEGEFVQSRVCAVHDRPFHVTFRHYGLGKVDFISHSRDCTETDTAWAWVHLLWYGKPQKDARTLPCAWCGNSLLQQCERCGSIVCGGLSDATGFRCRESCFETELANLLRRGAICR